MSMNSSGNSKGGSEMPESQQYERIRILRPCPDRALGPLFKPGEIVWGIRVEPPPGCRGFKGWRLRRRTTDPTEWLLEEGRDAELVEDPRATL